MIPRVLLADDDEAVRSMLQVALERDGFEVIAVAGVKDALRRIAEEKFDVLLSDLHMPHAGDGFTVVGAMRRIVAHVAPAPGRRHDPTISPYASCCSPARPFPSG